MSESIWNTVDGLVDGRNVDAATLNRPIDQLTSRTDYLKNAVDNILGSGTFTSVVATVSLSQKNTPEPGDIVAFDPDTRTYVKALASMSLFDAFRAAPSAYAVGFLKSVSGLTGTVVMFGNVDLSKDFQDVSRLMQKGEPFSSGLFYVSSTEPGKITAYPSGPRISIGTFCTNQQTGNGESAHIDPQYAGITDHVHRSYVLSARPVGHVSSSRGREKVTGYLPDSGNMAFPRLVVSGEWHTRKEVTYTIWLSGSGCDADGDRGSVPSSFDSVYVNWSSSDPEEPSGSVKVDGYFQEVAVGDHGMTVSLDSTFTDLSILYGDEEVSDDDRTWTLEMPHDGKGWIQNLYKANDDVFGLIKEGGSISDSYSIAYSKFGYDIRTVLDSFSDGGYLKIGDTLFLFVKVDENGGYEVDDNGIPAGFDDLPDYERIVVVTVGADGYETGRKIGGMIPDEKAHVVLVESSRKVYVFCDGAVYANGEELSPSVTGGVVSSFDDDGYSLFGSDGFAYMPAKDTLVYTNGASFYVVEVPDSYVVSSFENGLHGEGVYRYNMGMEEDLNLLFPPVPRKSGSLMLNGVELESDELYDKKGIYSIGPDTLYWMDDSVGYGPWGSYLEPDQETDNEPRLTFHFVTSFHSTTGPVTSLRPAKNAPVTVRQCGTTEDSTVGDLEIDVDLDFDVADASLPGYNAIKGSRQNRLLLGPVVEKISGGPGITVTQKKGHPQGQGVVTVSLSDYAYNGQAETIALENAKQEMIGMFPYIRLLGWTDESASIPSGFITKFSIPTSVNEGTYRIRMYLTVFGEESYEESTSLRYAGVSMSYNILPDFNTVSGTGYPDASLNLQSDLIAPNSEFVISIPLGKEYTNDGQSLYSYAAYDPILVHNDSSIDALPPVAYHGLADPFPNNVDCSRYVSTHVVSGGEIGVKPGYAVAVRFSRTNPSASGGSKYTGKIGFLSVRWALEEI